MIRFPAFTAFLFMLVCGATAPAQAKKNRIPESVEMALREAERFELLLLDPSERGDFHGWKVIKRSEMRDADVRKTILDELKRAVERSEGIAPREFNKPRYGVRVSSDKNKAEMVISFEEHKAILYLNGRQLTAVALTGEPAKLFDSLSRKEP